MRGKTAIGRTDLSRPLKHAIADGIINTDTRVLDYGCGLGDDIRRLRQRGYKVSGWDPVHRPNGEQTRAAVVNLGYVVNVIEDASERVNVLRMASKLADQVLIVSARLSLERKSLRNHCEYADGWITGQGTFQKFFDQQELRNWIDHALQTKAVAAAPGVFYVFTNEEDRSSFLATRYRRSSAKPRPREFPDLFSVHRELLEPLIQFATDRGRLPYDDELSSSSDINEVFGSLPRAFRVVLAATDKDQWTKIKHDRGEDLLVYLALSRFDGRSTFGRLPLSIQRDVRGLYGNYTKACHRADELLFSLGAPDVIYSACRKSTVGKFTPSALYVHRTALTSISPLLRLYEGCASGYLGRVVGANIIKLHLPEPMVSYLSYPHFNRDPHPVLAFSVTVHLQTFRVMVRHYANRMNRPLLHRKELFIAKDHPSYKKFARLTRIEESKGLYDNTTRIGFEIGWAECLAEKGVYFRGHRLLRVKG